jgi:hypothetical protein
MPSGDTLRPTTKTAPGPAAASAEASATDPVPYNWRTLSDPARATSLSCGTEITGKFNNSPNSAKPADLAATVAKAST